MSESISHPLTYYAYPGLMTGPGAHAALFDGLPTEISALCQVVQGLLLHVFWTERYGVELSEKRQQEVNIRSISHMLARIREMDDRPLTAARPLAKRLVGNCRDFSTMLCTMLRHQGVPARARCGFGAYFLPNHYEDHWDGWGLIASQDEDLTPDDWALLDRIAELTRVDDPPFAEVRAIYEDSRLRMPAEYAIVPQSFDLHAT